MSNRRLKHAQYFVQTDTGDHRLPAEEFHRNVAAGLLRRISDRIAKPARHVIAHLVDGKLKLLPVYSLVTFSMILDRKSPGVGCYEEYKLAKQYGTASFWAGKTYIDPENIGFLTP